MLTIIAAYTSAGILHEDVDGDVLAYDVEYPLSVADELWNAASDWASEAAPLLKDLNTARLLGFALKSPNEETDALRALFESWDENRSSGEIIEAGKHAANLLRDDYNVFVDVEFRPFQER
ncbi:hypothetical protein [Bifidobacterium longum]|nr:hypothetical protein [Bifidobacterium longum]